MDPFDPNDHRERCEIYLGETLGRPVRLLHFERLTKGTGEPPWRLDVDVAGVKHSYLLRLDKWRASHEYEVLRALEKVAVPTPHVYGRDLEGEYLGLPGFFCDFISGDTLLEPMLAGESWAETLYIDTVCELQAITRKQLASVAHRFGAGMTAVDYLADAYEEFREKPDPVAEAAYQKLKDTMPATPPVRFSNGDLWPENIIVRDRQLAGIIDFENAGFTDPVYEAIFPFFFALELRGRGLEERYCRRMGFDPAVLSWYRALELFDTWHWVSFKGKPFYHFTAEVLKAGLHEWLDAE
jgi:aminoglycoside phosphotransferase (APT) family kinase protein